MKQYVNIDGKQYSVTTRLSGDIEIHVYWDGYNVARRGLAREVPIHRSMHVSTTGRVGKRVLAALDEQNNADEVEPIALRERICQPVTVQEAGELMAGDWLPRRFRSRKAG
jgi:hypothetical protein